MSAPVMADVPIAVDWRSHPFILPPLDQRRCECCWALATAASIEGLYGIRTGLSLQLSAQLLVDCDDTNRGCRGGSPRKAFKWIIKNGGISKEEDYPFTAQQGECNESKKKNHAVSISGYTAVGKTEADLMKAVAAQPVVAGLALEKDNAYMKYKGGIFEGPCGPYLHAVTVIGIG